MFLEPLCWTFSTTKMSKLIFMNLAFYTGDFLGTGTVKTKPTPQNWKYIIHCNDRLNTSMTDHDKLDFYSWATKQSTQLSFVWMVQWLCVEASVQYLIVKSGFLETVCTWPVSLDFHCIIFILCKTFYLEFKWVHTGNFHNLNRPVNKLK